MKTARPHAQSRGEVSSNLIDADAMSYRQLLISRSAEADRQEDVGLPFGHLGERDPEPTLDLSARHPSLSASLFDIPLVHMPSPSSHRTRPGRGRRWAAGGSRQTRMIGRAASRGPQRKRKTRGTRVAARPGGAKASDAHLRPRRAGTDNAAAPAVTAAPLPTTQKDDRAANGASIRARPSQTVSFGGRETIIPIGSRLFSRRTEVPPGANGDQRESTGHNWPLSTGFDRLATLLKPLAPNDELPCSSQGVSIAATR